MALHKAVSDHLEKTRAVLDQLTSKINRHAKSTGVRGIKDTIDADRAGVDAALVKLGKVLAKLQPRYRAQDYDPNQEPDERGGEGRSVPGNTSGDGRDS
jgi:hypothetical protein